MEYIDATIDHQCYSKHQRVENDLGHGNATNSNDLCKPHFEDEHAVHAEVLGARESLTIDYYELWNVIITIPGLLDGNFKRE
jgi:hypothetical protein